MNDFRNESSCYSEKERKKQTKLAPKLALGITLCTILTSRGLLYLTNEVRTEQKELKQFLTYGNTVFLFSFFCFYHQSLFKVEDNHHCFFLLLLMHILCWVQKISFVKIRVASMFFTWFHKKCPK